MVTIFNIIMYVFLCFSLFILQDSIFQSMTILQYWVYWLLLVLIQYHHTRDGYFLYSYTLPMALPIFIIIVLSQLCCFFCIAHLKLELQRTHREKLFHRRMAGCLLLTFSICLPKSIKFCCTFSYLVLRVQMFKKYDSSNRQ